MAFLREMMETVEPVSISAVTFTPLLSLLNIQLVQVVGI